MLDNVRPSWYHCGMNKVPRKQINLRLSAKLYARLKRVAAKLQWPRNQTVAFAVQRFCEEQERTP